MFPPLNRLLVQRETVICLVVKCTTVPTYRRYSTVESVRLSRDGITPVSCSLQTKTIAPKKYCFHYIRLSAFLLLIPFCTEDGNHGTSGYLDPVGCSSVHETNIRPDNCYMAIVKMTWTHRRNTTTWTGPPLMTEYLLHLMRAVNF